MNYERNYESMQAKWEATKPIRAREVDTRPIGDRGRTHELIAKIEVGEAPPSYVARLYNTHCVEYFADGSIIVRTGGWETQTTTSFINLHSPFWCWKEHGMVWIRTYTDGNAYPVSLFRVEKLKFVRDEQGIYVPDPSVPLNLKQLQVNKPKMREMRRCIAPFMKWAEKFLALSDGWIMHETRKEVLGWNGSYFDTPRAYESTILGCAMDGGADDVTPEKREEIFLQVLCSIPDVLALPDKLGINFKMQVAEAIQQQNQVNQVNQVKKFFDYHITPTTLKNILHRAMHNHHEARILVPVEPRWKAIKGLSRYSY